MPKISIPRDEIEKILPHREPFLFVDEVTQFELDTSILAKRLLRKNEPYFQGHFPKRPIMPGVLIAEALAQTSGLLLALSAKERNERPEGKIFYLAKADIKWLKPVVPDETILLESRLQRNLGALTSFFVKAFTKRSDVAAGTLTLARIEG